MPEKSAATYITAPIDEDGDVLAAVTASRGEAATRLGGEDGLQPEHVNRLDDTKVAITWRRVWNEAEATVEDQAAEAARQTTAAIERNHFGDGAGPGIRPKKQKNESAPRDE